MPPANDEAMMAQCLALAGQALGRTAPNPAVGALVLDRNGDVAGTGFHPAAGQPHAEVFALEEAGQRASGGTLYVSLEPCCHEGRTPPCLSKVLDSGVSRVVIGMKDLNPLVSGKSIETLRSKGIDTEYGVMEERCRYLNRGFVKKMTENLPWVALKIAATLDGRIADRSGTSQWITGVESRMYVHQLRNEFDCILVGSGTVQADNPSLTVRDIAGGRNPVRLIVDGALKCSPDSKLFNDGQAKTVVFAAESGAERSRPFLRQAEVVRIASGMDGKIDLRGCIEWVGAADYNTVLLEGGAGLAGAMLDAGLVDEVFWFVSPKLLADGHSVAALSGRSRALSEALAFRKTEVRRFGDDILVTGILSDLL